MFQDPLLRLGSYNKNHFIGYIKILFVIVHV
ncbi:unnamed protein product, partial [marine sediment metagenome]